MVRALNSLSEVGTMEDYLRWLSNVVVDAGSGHIQPLYGIGLERERWLSPAFIRGDDYGTRASTVLLIDHDGHGQMHERRFGAQGAFLGESRVTF